MTAKEVIKNIRNTVIDYLTIVNDECKEDLDLLEKIIDNREELLKRLFNVCKTYKHTSIALSDDSEFLNVMEILEKELDKNK